MKLFNFLKRKGAVAEADSTLVNSNSVDDQEFIRPDPEDVTITDKYGAIQRIHIRPERIDDAQKEWASPEYVKRLYETYFSDYPEKPFISKDREYFTSWEETIHLFPAMMLPKERMIRFNDGLLPGHIYMLYWIFKIHKKHIPVYFEYEYGIQFEAEKQFLIQRGELSEDGNVSEAGFNSMKAHVQVILEKTPSADLSFLNVIKDNLH